MATFNTFNDAVDMTQLGILDDFATATFGHENDHWFTFSSNGETYMFRGSDFTYGANGDPTGGTITHIRAVDQSGANEYVANDINISVQQFETFAQTNDLSGFENAIFDGNDIFHVAAAYPLSYFVGGDGNDTFDFNVPSAGVDGGAGYNTIKFSEGFGYNITPGTLENIQKIVLESGTYSIFLEDHNDTDPDMSGGKPLTIDGHLLTASESLTFFADDQTVPVTLLGGAGNDTLYGGTGRGTFYGGMGFDILGGFAGHNNTYIYHAVAESTGVNADLINGFNAKTDHFEIPTAVTGVDAAINGGSLSAATFDADLTTALQGHLEANHAILFTPDSGDIGNGKDVIILVIDQNGIPGYQDGGDLVMFLVAGHSENLSHLSVSDFTVWPG